MPPAPPETHDALAIKGWNLMGGALDWHALPVVTELLGITDIETFVHRLAAIREWQANNRD